MGLGPTDDHGRHNNRAPGEVASARAECDEFSGITQLNTLYTHKHCCHPRRNGQSYNFVRYRTVFEYSTLLTAILGWNVCTKPFVPYVFTVCSPVYAPVIVL